MIRKRNESRRITAKIRMVLVILLLRSFALDSYYHYYFYWSIVSLRNNLVTNKLNGYSVATNFYLL